MSDRILVVRCGTVPYEDGLRLQKALEARRQAGEVDDILLLLEHPPVYTKGRRVTPEELPMGEAWYEAQGIEVLDTNRGGHVTYHGPGQLVAYPIVSLESYDNDVHAYVRGLEQVMIGALAESGIEAGLIPGETGVWVGELKIGAIGLHVSRGVTTHGLAVNVCNDLQPFGWVLACQIEGGRVTSVSRERGSEQSVAAFADSLVASYAEVFERRPLATEPAELGLELPAATLGSPR
jgi:lipoyl(octanoyl) transferase